MRQKMGEKEKIEKRSGFSLVELMLVMALMSIFSMFIVNLVMLSRHAYEIQLSSTRVRDEAKRGIEAMLKELRQTSLSNPNGVTIAGGNAQINFAVPNQVTQAGIQSWRPVEFSYDAANQQIVRTEGGANPSVLAKQIQSLQFARVNEVVTATVTTQANTSTDGYVTSARLISQITMRN